MSAYPLRLFIEDAVEQDNAVEKVSVESIVQSYLSRFGFAETLRAFNEESDPTLSTTSEAYSSWVEQVQKRKEAQLLCLGKQYKEAAASLPPASLLRIKLLCKESENVGDLNDSLVYLATEVGPLVPLCEEPALAHTVYTAFFQQRLLSSNGAFNETDKDLAAEINETLLESKEPSSLAVLLAWKEWQYLV